MSDRIIYMRTTDSTKWLPFQFYNTHKLISLPADQKRVFIPKWPSKTKTVEPDRIGLNTCLLTGKINNLTVVDIDVKDNGMAVYKSLFKDMLTPTVITPSGGVHLYFRYNAKLPSMNRLMDKDGKRIGIDIKNDRSVIIAPPSSLNGKRYRFMRGRSLNDLKPIRMPRFVEQYILDHLKTQRTGR